jgi:ferritin-like metal-binding protein YciE
MKNNNIDKYLNLIYFQEGFINENINSIIRKINQNKIKDTIISKLNDIKQIEKQQNISNINKIILPILKKIPSIDIETINKICKEIPNFKKMKKTSEIVLKNSISNISDNAIDIASTFLSVASIINNKNSNITQDQNLNKNIKLFIYKFRKLLNIIDINTLKNKNINDTENIKIYFTDYIIGITIIILSTELITLLSNGVYITITSSISIIILLIILLGTIDSLVN